jgi:outer membrane lipoprotein carrier protein
MNPERLLSSSYQVNQVGSQDVRVFQLTPTGSSALFQRLEITFEKGTLKSLQILDWQQQQTEIRFENVVVNQDLPPTLFQLAVPEGTDVIRG